MRKEKCPCGTITRQHLSHFSFLLFPFLIMQQRVTDFISKFQDSDAHIEVQTSGSTGIPKRMLVEKSRMLASARRTNDVLGLKAQDVALVCLPVDYIAGKMMVVRALERGMRIEVVTPSANPLRDFDASRLGAQTLLAITPHQLAELLVDERALQILNRVSHIIIGGGALPERVEQMAKSLPSCVYATYGMTETLSHIALRRINGAKPESYFTPLEGVMLAQDTEGCLIISDSLTTDAPLVTNDLVELLPDGRFRILGRRDNVVCSGGVKLQIEELERKLSEVISASFLLTYVSDERLGQALTMLFTGELTKEELLQLCTTRVGRYEVPKHFFRVSQLPMTETGKPARSMAHQVAEERLRQL